MRWSDGYDPNNAFAQEQPQKTTEEFEFGAGFNAFDTDEDDDEDAFDFPKGFCEDNGQASASFKVIVSTKPRRKVARGSSMEQSPERIKQIVTATQEG